MRWTLNAIDRYEAIPPLLKKGAPRHLDSPHGHDAAVSPIDSHAEDLGARLAIWQACREPEGHICSCASDAVGAIDAMLADLHGVRAQLVSEIRQADDAADRRADDLPHRGGDPPAPETTA